MRIVAGVLILVCVTVQAQWTMVVAADSVPVYLNEIRKMYEKPLFSLSGGQAVTATMERDGKTLIETVDGKKGWVSREFLKPENEQRLYMKEVSVLGYLDNVDPVYILDFEKDNFKPIRMAKDFLLDPLYKRDVVREEFEWENEIYYYKDVKFTPEKVEKEFDLK